MRQFNIEYFLGVDGISITMVLLTALISLVAMVASLPWWGKVDSHHFSQRKVPGYMVMFLMLETGMLGTFCAMDFFMFYIFWELMLLPMYFLIGIWGGPRKEYAAIKFFLYTLAGSVLMLLCMLGLYYTSGPSVLADGTATPHTFNIMALSTMGQGGLFAKAAPILGIAFSKIIFVGLFIGFAIKVPMFPFHTWLPDAHVEAPTPISRHPRGHPAEDRRVRDDPLQFPDSARSGRVGGHGHRPCSERSTSCTARSCAWRSAT